MRVSHDIRITTFVRMSLCFIFSQDSRELFACFLKNIARQSYDCRTTFVRVSRNFRIVNSTKISRRLQVRDTCTNVVRLSHDSLATFFGEKKNRLNKTFATSSRHMKILATLVRHSHECRAKGPRQIRNTFAGNSHASEILAFLEVIPIKIFLCEFKKSPGNRPLLRCKFGVQVYSSNLLQVFYTELRVGDSYPVILHPRGLALARKTGAMVILQHKMCMLKSAISGLEF